VSSSWGSAADVGNRAKILFTRGFAGLIVTGIFARLVFVLIPGNVLRAQWSGGGDAEAYVLLAQNVVAHRGLTYAGQPTAFRPPGYPLLLAAFMDVFERNYVLAIRLLRFFEVFLCAAIARTLSARERRKHRS